MNKTPNYLNLIIDGSGIASITLSREAQHNAFDDKMVEELLGVLEQIKPLDQIRIVILKALGKSFSAGADLDWMQRMKHSDSFDNLADASQLAKLMHTLYSLPQTTIALVQGAAYGGGVGLVACCDVALGTPCASFCFSEVKLGLTPSIISPYVIRAIGQHQTKRYFLTAEKISAERALALGLLHEIVGPQPQPLSRDSRLRGEERREAESSTLLERGYALAQQMLTYGPTALKAAKQLVQTTAELSLSPALIKQTVQQIADLRVSHEAQERLQSFLEKRGA